MKQKFYDLFIKGLISENKADDYVNEWHNGDSELSLQEYLGMSDTIYNEWVIHGLLTIEQFMDKYGLGEEDMRGAVIGIDGAGNPIYSL